MSDERREWVQANRDCVIEILVPRAFLKARVEASAPAAPELLDARLSVLGRARPAAGNCVRTDWPLDLLRPLAEHAEDCAQAWSTGAWNIGHIAASALAEHARQHIVREFA